MQIRLTLPEYYEFKVFASWWVLNISLFLFASRQHEGLTRPVSGSGRISPYTRSCDSAHIAILNFELLVYERLMSIVTDFSCYGVEYLHAEHIGPLVSFSQLRFIANRA
jgi:hypothetical protein